MGMIKLAKQKNYIIRDYYRETEIRNKLEMERYQRFGGNRNLILESLSGRSLIRYQSSIKHDCIYKDKSNMINDLYSQEVQLLVDENVRKARPFEYYSENLFEGFPENRKPARGIKGIERIYHKGRIVTANDEIPESGYKRDVMIDEVLKDLYPETKELVDEYCRPLGTTDATFESFNKEQVKSEPVNEQRKARVLKHVKRILNAKP